MTKTALITGATSGIGQATAQLLAQHQINLIICGRRTERLQLLEKELSKKVKVHALTFDVRNKTEVFTQIASLPSEFQTIDILINNAGNAHGLAPFHQASLDDFEAMLDINVKGLIYVTKAICGQMVERKSGQIINLGSVAGKEVYPNGNVYCASKFAVDALNQALRIDLNAYGIRVGSVNPGMVATEFSEVRFKGDTERAKGVYEGYKALLAEDIARIILFMVQTPAHVNISDLSVFPTAQASATILNKS